MILSILICSLESRASMLVELIAHLNKQILELDAVDKVQVLTDVDNGQITTGEKRNKLLHQATGNYVVFIDDDDWVSDYYISEILNAAKEDSDCMAINGIMTTNGTNEKKWFISIKNEWVADWTRGYEVYLRYPNHIAPIKREFALRAGFPHVNNFEDKAYADRLRIFLKSETTIDKPMYHYKYLTYNKSY